jgi:hypothetical protein
MKGQNGRYFLTASGRVIYKAEMDLETKIESALKDYWKPIVWNLSQLI